MKMLNVLGAKLLLFKEYDINVVFAPISIIVMPVNLTKIINMHF